MKVNLKTLFLPLLLISILAGCKNDLKVNAPPKDLLAVYGVLNPQADTNFIRISKVYLTDGDAIQYGKDNDVSLKNARVTLWDGQDSIVLFALDRQKVQGDFNAYYTIWATTTKLKGGKTYKLDVKTDNPNLTATAETVIPDAPSITEPAPPQQFGFSDCAFHSKDLLIKFLSSKESVKHRGKSFEIRIYLRAGYQQAGTDTIWFPQDLMYGPTPPFTESTGAGSDCNSPANYCYRLGQDYVKFLRTSLPPVSGRSYVYDNSNYSKACRVEITAVDSFLTNYIRVNNPAFVDFNTVKPEYTNIKGGIGVLGAINLSYRYCLLSKCTEYLAGLNGTTQPDSKCILQ